MIVTQSENVTTAMENITSVYGPRTLIATTRALHPTQKVSNNSLKKLLRAQPVDPVKHQVAAPKQCL